MDLLSPHSSCWYITFSTASHASHLSKCVTCVVSCEMYTRCSRLPLLCKAAKGSDCEERIPAEVNMESNDSCGSSHPKPLIISPHSGELGN